MPIGLAFHIGLLHFSTSLDFYQAKPDSCCNL